MYKTTVTTAEDLDNRRQRRFRSLHQVDWDCPRLRYSRLAYKAADAVVLGQYAPICRRRFHRSADSQSPIDCRTGRRADRTRRWSTDALWPRGTGAHSPLRCPRLKSRRSPEVRRPADGDVFVIDRVVTRPGCARRSSQLPNTVPGERGMTPRDILISSPTTVTRTLINCGNDRNALFSCGRGLAVMASRSVVAADCPAIQSPRCSTLLADRVPSRRTPYRRGIAADHHHAKLGQRRR